MDVIEVLTLCLFELDVQLSGVGWALSLLYL